MILFIIFISNGWFCIWLKSIKIDYILSPIHIYRPLFGIASQISMWLKSIYFFSIKQIFIPVYISSCIEHAIFHHTLVFPSILVLLTLLIPFYFKFRLWLLWRINLLLKWKGRSTISHCCINAVFQSIFAKFIDAIIYLWISISTRFSCLSYHFLVLNHNVKVYVISDVCRL